MNNQNNNQNEDWLDQILGRQNVPRELGPDELAVSGHRLTHPDEMDLERIVQETIAEAWEDEKKVKTTPTPPVTRATAPVSTGPELPKQAAPVEKKPEKKKGGYGMFGIPHVLSTLFWAFLIIFIGTALGRLVWVCATDLLALGKDPVAATITIDKKDDMDDVAKKLEKAGLIRYPDLFVTFAKMTNKGNNRVIGTITFDEKTVYDYNAIINAISSKGGSSVTVEVTIPEGYNCAQIFALLEKKGVCKADDLCDYVKSLGDEKEYSEGAKEKARLCSNYWFIRELEFGHQYALEGFLFPDTYEFYLKDDPDRIIEKMLDAFNTRFTQRLLDKYFALKKSLGIEISLYEVITVASIVEKESANPDESYTIASVFYNRLTNSSRYPYLNSDATIIYDTDYRSKGQLKTNQAINNSPYNTYTQTGLPPTPIANPGLDSLDAALDPAVTEPAYFFFVYDEDAGVHRFSSSLAEHQEWLKKLGY